MALPPPGPHSHVVVTGASSGIGAAVARGLSDRGYPTVLVARRGERLASLADELLDARSLPADLTVDEDRTRVRDVILGDPGVVGLVNAAGFGRLGLLADLAGQAPEALDAMVRLNVLALHDLTGAAVTALVARGAGAICNVSSVGAFAPLPTGATYAASKAFVQSFSEAVHAELAGTGVSLTTVSPGMTRTEFDEVAGVAGTFEHVPSAVLSEPEDVAEAAIVAMVAGRRAVVPGMVNQVGAFAARVVPRSALLGAIAVAQRWM